MKAIISISKKELIYILRDTRTIFLGIIIPIIFMIVFGYFVDNILSNTSDLIVAKYLFFVIISMMLFLSMLTGSLEIGVGEKERGTLIGILRTGVEFHEIFIGKIIALIMQGVVTLFIMNISMLIFSFFSNGFYDNIINGENLKLFLIFINIIALYNILFFSSVELLISFIARNFKEGQLLSFPIMMFILCAYYYVLYSKFYADLNLYYYLIPFVNTAVIAKQICQNNIASTELIIFMISNIIYIILTTMVTHFIMKKESNLARI